MNIQCQEIEYCKLNIRYVATPEKVKNKQEEALSQFKKFKISGFRPGKAPDYVIKNKFKEQINKWVKQELLTQAYQDILFETKIKPLAQPQVVDADLHQSEFWCELTVYKRPEFELQPYVGLEIPKPALPWTKEERTAQILEKLRTDHGDFVPYEDQDFVQLHDRVTMSVQMKDGEMVVENLSKTGILYTVGEKLYPNFDEEILGMKPDEEREFPILIEDTKYTCQAKLYMGLKHTPAALDDTLAQKLNLENFEALKQEVDKISAQRFDSESTQLINQQIINRLLASYTFEVPAWYALMEAQHITQCKTEADWVKLALETRERALATAKNNIKLAFILDAIREAEPETAFTNNELINLLKHKVATVNQNPEQWLVEAQQNGTLIGVIAKLRNEMVLQWITSKTKFIE